jgi:hypothetical protein
MVNPGNPAIAMNATKDVRVSFSHIRMDTISGRKDSIRSLISVPLQSVVMTSTELQLVLGTTFASIRRLLMGVAGVSTILGFLTRMIQGFPAVKSLLQTRSK